VTGGLWKLPEPWTPKTAPTAPWKTTEQVFHSSHRPSSSFLSDPETESANLSTKPGQPHDRPERSACGAQVEHPEQETRNAVRDCFSVRGVSNGR
jgi:hypothetical protein